MLLLDEGNGARQVLRAPGAPIRTVVVGIVDAVEISATRAWQQTGSSQAAEFRAVRWGPVQTRMSTTMPASHPDRRTLVVRARCVTDRLLAVFVDHDHEPSLEPRGVVEMERSAMVATLGRSIST